MGKIKKLAPLLPLITAESILNVRSLSYISFLFSYQSFHQLSSILLFSFLSILYSLFPQDESYRAAVKEVIATLINSIDNDY